jgi:gas vesicle protein
VAKNKYFFATLLFKVKELRMEPYMDGYDRAEEIKIEVRMLVGMLAEVKSKVKLLKKKIYQQAEEEIKSIKEIDKDVQDVVDRLLNDLNTYSETLDKLLNELKDLDSGTY